MSEEDLELLVTLDDPGEEEDTFSHLQTEDNLEFGQGDWTCTLSRLTGTTSNSMKGLEGNTSQSPNKKFEIEVCTVTCTKNGEIVKQKVFYNLVGMPKHLGVM